MGGILAMSRAFGNRLLKRFVVADPEIQVSLDAHKLCISSIVRRGNTIEPLSDI